MRVRLLFATFVAAQLLAAGMLSAAEPAATPAGGGSADQPLHALLVLGGCCHDYKAQKKILAEGISARANVEWTIVHEGDGVTTHRHSVFEKPDWSKGFDVVVHDECSADVKDLAFIENILKPHKEGLPAVVLHCGMHCYRSEGWPQKVTPWFEFTGLQTTGHGAQQPIALAFVDKESPITQGMADWTTIKEELYNNIAGHVLDTARPLIRGKQGNSETVVAWTNTYGKAKVFATTIGHNNETVGDPRYLDLVTRGLLWSVGKLDDQHLKPAKKVLADGQAPDILTSPAPKVEKPAATDKPAKKPAGPAAGVAPGTLVPQNLAEDKPATSSSNQGDEHVALMATDGDLETRWCASGGDMPQWWQVDLGKAEDLAGCRITWEKNAGDYRCKIEGSPDGKAWSTLADRTKSPVATRVEDERFDGKGVRYVRVTIEGAAPGHWASFNEVEVFGTKMVPAPAAVAAATPAGKSGKTGKAAAGAKKNTGIDPTKIAETLKAPAGFNATVFAAPPDVNYPTCVAAVPTGELFVGIDEQGSLGKEPGRGRIVKCFDTNGDGKADRFVDFAKIDHPRGLIWDDGKLFVLHPPFLSVYYDDNGDGVADRSEVLVKGISNPDSIAARGADHTTNGIRLGIDGWIYIAVGDFGCHPAEGKDGTKLEFHSGGVLRVRPDGSGLEVYSRGQRNIYDVAIDPLMNVFTRDNTNDGDGWNDRLSHVVPTGNYGYPRLFKHFQGDFVDCMVDYGGGAPCGSLFVSEPGLPDGLGNALLTVEWGRSVIDAHPLTPSGAGFIAGQKKLMDLPRGTDIDVDGASRLYASSWAGGGFSYSGPNIGYVVRLAPTGYAAPAFPDLRKAADDDLLRHLASPSGVLRQATQREMLRRGDKPAFDAGLEKLAGANDASLPARAAAVFTLKLLRGDKADEALAGLTERDDLREIALRALADNPKDAGAPLKPLVDGLADANPRVRMIAAWAVGRLNRADAAAALVPLTVDADLLVSHVSVNALVAMRAYDVCLKAVDPANPKAAPGVLKALQQMHETAVVDGLTSKLTAAQGPALRGEILRALCRLYFTEAEWTGQWWGTRPDTTGPYFKTAEWAGTPRVKQALVAALQSEKPEVLRGLVLDLQKHRIDVPEAKAAFAKAMAGDPTMKASAIEALLTKPQPTDEDVVLAKSVAADEKAEPALRAKAVRALARIGTVPADDAVVDALAPVVAAEKPDKDLAAALEEFVRDTKHAKAVPYFAKLTDDKDAARREIGYSVLVSLANSRLSTAEAKAAAAKVIEKGWDKPAQAAPLLRAVGRLKADGYKDFIEAMVSDPNKDLARAAGYAATRLGMNGVAPAPGALEVIETVGYDKTVAFVLKDKGDAALGQELFTRQGCIACHTTTAAEAPKGPLLAGIAQRYSRAELCESIMKPSAKIAQGFETQWFKTKDGDTVEGFVTREGGDDVELRNVAGIVAVVKKADVKDRGKRDTSMMPEGLVIKLSPHDLASIIAYLESLKAK